MKTTVMEALRGHFQPEFLNRIDELIVLHTLNREQLHQIVDSMLGVDFENGRFSFQVVGRPVGHETTLAH